MIFLNKTENKKPVGSNLFLLEIIIALLFFCISGAVILQVFAAANGTILKNKRTDRAVLCGQSLAESYSQGGELSYATEAVFGKPLSPVGITLDKEFRYDPTGSITLNLSEKTEVSEAGTLSTATAVFIYDGAEFYRLEFSAYTPRNGGNDE